jgi:ABC-2 type transport system permease protein
MTQAWVLGQRALREAWRTPDAMLPTLFIPLFFLVVNVGQAAKIFPAASTSFLHGQGYGAFQLPSSLLLAASSRTSRAATSTSCARRPCRGRRSCWAA